MKILLLTLCILLTYISHSQVKVRGYYRKDGTYVRPHQRTRPNNTVTDNYSYRGNYNPNNHQVTGGSSPSTTTTIPARTFSAPITITEPSVNYSNYAVQIDTSVHTLELANELEFLRKSPEVREDNIIMGVPQQSIIAIYDLTTKGYTLVKFRDQIGFFPTKSIFVPKKKRFKFF